MRPTTTAAPAPHADAIRDVAWARARELAHACAQPAGTTEAELHAAAGLTLADDLLAAQALPGFDTSAIDGYAVGPGPGPWHVHGTVPAGTTWHGGPLAADAAVAVSTGAPVPTGTHAVIPVEDAARTGDLLAAPRPAPGRHIRRAGEDAMPGTLLAPAGTRIGPALLGLAAACGLDRLHVHRRPRVQVLVTGDELEHSGTAAPGRIRDALGPLLPPLIATLGGETCDLQHVPDTPATALATALLTPAAARRPHVTVVTGSTSVGTTDRLRSLLHDGGAHWVVDTVACRPGHPQLLAQWPPGRWVVGLPGNPYAALAAAHTLLAPLLAALSGRPLPALPHAPLQGDVHPAPGRTRLIPVRWDGATVRPAGGHRPAFLHGAALADALAAVPPGWAPGQAVPLMPSAG